MERTVNRDRGTGLARGPALIIGAILTAFGLILFLKNGVTSTEGFPDGSATGDTFLGFETNGWTAFITTAAGGLLLFGAAQHLLAKAISLIVGLALGFCAVAGFVDGDVLGLAASNGWTELGWGIAAVLLLLNVFAPRTDGDVDRNRDSDVSDRRAVDSRHRDRDLEREDARPMRDGATGEHVPAATDDRGTSRTAEPAVESTTRSEQPPPPPPR